MTRKLPKHREVSKMSTSCRASINSPSEYFRGSHNIVRDFDPKGRAVGMHCAACGGSCRTSGDINPDGVLN